MKTIFLTSLSFFSILVVHATAMATDAAPIARCQFQLGRVDPDQLEFLPADKKAYEITLKEEKNSMGQKLWRGEALLSSALSQGQTFNYSAKAVIIYKKSDSFWESNVGRLDTLTLLLDYETQKTLALTRASSDQVTNPTMLERFLKRGVLKTVSTVWNPNAVKSTLSTPFIEEAQQQWADSGEVNNSMAIRLDSICELKESL
jgi:hypothetical protein